MLSMLPFAAVMAIAALGQTLVVSHGGIDLSVPGGMALAAVLATKLPAVSGVPVWAAVALGLVAGRAGRTGPSASPWSGSPSRRSWPRWR
ncbi:hypothetical protein [Streptosporangium vulgare]|uniref:hypothetical protein n=1 Tax=Streptosporangium vulgare TaxID=46190 RepID=UPI0031D9307D